MQLESERLKSKAEKFAYAVEGIAYLSDCKSLVVSDYHVIWVQQLKENLFQ